MKIYKSKYRAFIFEHLEFDPVRKLIKLEYSYDGKLKFREEIVFNFDFKPSYNPEALEKAIFGLFIISGISYYKAYLAPTIIIKQGSLTPRQAEFFNQVYLMGLGEFLYQNQLDPKLIAKFPSRNSNHKSVEIPGLQGSLLPIGGGTDSLLAAEILKTTGQKFTTFRVDTNPWVAKLMKIIGQPSLNLRRTLAPELFKINKTDALNGHVPISAIISFLAITSAILSGKQNIIMANESSADKGNTTYRGMAINHQYSKSLEFEQNLQKYIYDFISPSINYFSLLRPLSELKIIELFTARYLDKYQGHFCSCNRNFAAKGTDKPKWCGKCAKCASMFGLMSAFVPRQQLIKLFGKNLYAELTLKNLFNELLGNSGIKPFDCVGDIEEMRVALKQAYKSGQWPELSQFKIPKSQFDYQKLGPHSIPDHRA